jgi:hypothetical protein
MTEAEWLAGTDVSRALEFAEGRLSPRRARLLAAALCRAAAPLLDHPDLARALNEIEWYADGRTGARELGAVSQKFRFVAIQQYERSLRAAERDAPDAARADVARSELAWAVVCAAAVSVTVRDVVMRLSGEVARSLGAGLPAAPTVLLRDAEQAALLRDLVGNPFRPAAFDAEWRTSTAVAIAKQMYDARDFSAMPILADALQDAGCDRDDILSHCRDANGVHVRGCWVADLVLGKE